MLPTIGLLILVSIVGAWLVRREGTSVIKRVQDQLANAKMPTNELIDGAMIVGGGALMLTPGFLTDIIGVSLLLPPIRALLRPMVAKAVKSRVKVVSPFDGTMGSAQSSAGGFGGFGFGGGFGNKSAKSDRGDVFDVDSTDITRRGKLDPPAE